MRSQSSRPVIRVLAILALLASFGLSVAIAQGIIIPIGPGSALASRSTAVRPLVSGHSLFLSGR